MPVLGRGAALAAPARLAPDLGRFGRLSVEEEVPLPAAGRLLSSPGLGVQAPEPDRGRVLPTAQQLATWRGDGLQKALGPRAA